MLGIMLGGFIKGIEKDGLVKINGWLLLIFILIVSNLQQSLFLMGKGSKYKSFFSSKKEQYSFGSTY